jgi:hypothetical protein
MCSAVLQPRTGSNAAKAMIHTLNNRTVLMALVLGAILVECSACTFIGIDQPATREAMDWGPSETIPTCVYLDHNVNRGRANELISGWNDNEGDWFKLRFQPVSYEELDRDASDLFYYQIANQLEAVPKPDRCAKQVWFVNRNLFDAAYGLGSVSVGLPEVLGWTDDETRSKVFTYADAATVNQLFMWPSMVTRHELYHTLGCDHFFMTECYQRIQNFKRTWEYAFRDDKPEPRQVAIRTPGPNGSKPAGDAPAD